MRRRQLLTTALAGGSLAGLGVLGGCASRSSTSPGPAPGSGGATGSPAINTPSATPGASAPDSSAAPSSVTSPCAQLVSTLDLAQRCGQLLMVGITEPRPEQSILDQWSELGVGFALVLGDRIRGRSSVASLTSRLSGVNAEVPLVVAVDQEGGRVQRLTGEGFSSIPSAVEQSRLPQDELRRRWEGWGAELARAGVLWNLAPVADVVPAAMVASNAPIGQLRRHYGTTADQALPALAATVAGLAAAGVASSLKHFPGLGQVRTNTDFGEATDEVTTADSDELRAFAALLGRQGGAAGALGSVMVSSAVHTGIDPDHRAVFSRTVITDLLRGRLGHQGLVVSDDLGAAASVAEVPPGERATRFVAAGGDVVICADPSLVPAMVEALVQRASTDEGFAARVTESAARALTLKQAVGALSC